MRVPIRFPQDRSGSGGDLEIVDGPASPATTLRSGHVKCHSVVARDNGPMAQWPNGNV